MPRAGRVVAHLSLAAAWLLAAVSFAGPALAHPLLPSGACSSAGVVAHALPAIVNITVVKVLPQTQTTPTAPPLEQIEVFVGSGFVIDPSGIIVTNKHVIKDAAVIRVTFQNRQQVPAQLIAAAGLVDEALLKVHMPAPLPALAFGDSDDLKLGEPVIAVGNPIGLGTSVSTGVVSGLNRDLMRTPFDDFIQTDATINPGNSGGPLLDCQGKVVGMDTALVSNSKLLGSIGLGFAMPANDVRFVADKLLNPNAPQPDWIGLHLQDLTQPLAMVFGRPDMTGAIVTGVEPDGPAAHSPLQPGDIITGVDGEKQPDARAILRAIVVKPAGAPITLSVWQNGHGGTISVQGRAWPHLRALRSDVLASAVSVERAEAQGLGLTLGPMTPAARRRLGLPPGQGVLVTSVTPGSQAQFVGLEAGDAIERIDREPVTAPADVMARLRHGNAAQGDFVALLVRGKAGTKWVTLYVGRIDMAELVAPPSPASLERSANGKAARLR